MKRWRSKAGPAGLAFLLSLAPLAQGPLTAHAATGSVLADIVPSEPTGNGRGMAFDGTNLWYTIVGDSHIYAVTTTGAAVAAIAVGGGVSTAGPLAWDGSHLWTANYSNPSSKLFEIDPSTGTVLGGTCDFVAANPGDPAIPAPKGISANPDGLDFGGGSFWMSGEGDGNPANFVVNLDTSCNDLSHFPSPVAATGPDDGNAGNTIVIDPFNGNKLWNSVEGDFSHSHIYLTDTAGTFLGVDFNTIHLTEDLAFDDVTFAPKCAVWGNEATNSGTNHLTAYEVPCPERAIKASGVTITSTEGQPFTGTVATFTDPDPAATAAEYSAMIDWGDAMTSVGTVTGPMGGPFTVTGSHVYQQEGSYTVTVTITDIDSPTNTATATSTATVDDAALAATCAAPAAIPTSYSGPTAALTDANSFGTTSDFTATISWGDASSSAGTVTGPMGGPFVVSGTHTYAAPGPYTITTTINDDGGATASTSCSVIAFAVVAAGGFVIGDGNSALGTDVTFWGARWSRLNTLSGGSAPAAFKGFEDTPPAATCGTSWSTDPGNSTPPPDGPLPAFMAVIVSSSISKSGSTISGNTVHVVVVRTNPGYEPNPGHEGTGTVVAQVC